MWQMMNQMMGAWGTGMMWFNFLTGVLFLVLLIVGIVAVAKLVFAEGSWRGRVATETALDILKQRYARGELTKEEFEAKKRDIA
ncbi:MAG: SHOCT domain-containing protein, partial [Candidatus Methylomirabilales bacterium]